VALGCKPSSESDLEWVGVHTPVPNMLVAELIKAKLILPDLRSYKTEHQLNSQTRLDGLATTESGDEIFIEIKNVTLARLTYPKNLHRPHPLSSSIESNSIGSNSTGSNFTGEPVWIAEFPDSVTKRGQKHLVEMMDILRAGKRSLMIFVVQRGDCSGFRPAADLDPSYSKLFADYLKCGGEALALSCRVSPRGVQFLKVLPLSTSGEISE
jgi:sugar fermentation stimulation protein A